MANTYTLIEAKTLGSTTATVTFSSIPQTYTDLKLVYSARSTTTGTQELIKADFNGNTSNYTIKTLQGDGYVSASGSYSYSWIGYSVGGGSTSNTFSNGDIYIPNYTNPSTYKASSPDCVCARNDRNSQMWLASNLWSNNSAITSIVLTIEGGNSFVAYTNFYLYGIKNS
jgi:hypothetical protein